MRARSSLISKNRGICNHKSSNWKMFASLRKIDPSKQTLAFFLVIGLFAVGGIWLLLYSTPKGLGLNDDSIAYIAGARSIMSGNGYREAWLASNGPWMRWGSGYAASPGSARCKKKSWGC